MPPRPRDKADDDEIKTLIHYTAEKVSIFDVLDLFGIQYRGKRTQKIRCIFPLNHIRGDQNPSGRIHAQKNRYTCYSCNEGGDPVYVAKFLGGFKSIGETIGFLNKELYLQLDTDPELQRLLGQKEQPLNAERERVSRIRVLESQLVTRMAQLRDSSPYELYRLKHLPYIESLWEEWEAVRDTGDYGQLQQRTQEFLQNLQGVARAIQRERFEEEVLAEELELWG